MPELPDVEVIKRYIDATSLHKKISRVEVKDDSVLNVAAETLRKHIESKTFEKTVRIGKHLLLSTGAQKWLALHFGMTGKVNYDEDGQQPPDHTRLLFHFNEGGRLMYICRRKLGSVDITENCNQFCKEHELGQDALQVDLKTFRKLLDGKHGMIKSALMDQSTIAGIGNVYSDEILYQCRIHPETKIKKLTDEQVKQLHGSMQRILKTAINNQAKPADMPDHYLISHRQESAKCPDCGGHVKRIKVSGRGCYICPKCQQKS